MIPRGVPRYRPALSRNSFSAHGRLFGVTHEKYSVYGLPRPNYYGARLNDMTWPNLRMDSACLHRLALRNVYSGTLCKIAMWCKQWCFQLRQMTACTLSGKHYSVQMIPRDGVPRYRPALYHRNIAFLHMGGFSE